VLNSTYISKIDLHLRIHVTKTGNRDNNTTMKAIVTKRKRITTRQYVVVFIGFAISASMGFLWIHEGTNHFFSLVVKFRGKYINEAYFLVLGLIILCFGVFDIVISQKHIRK